ncbi:MAG: hypothetical protein ACJ76H_17050 [Bacteriovoracaceae bacterium]
MKLTALLFVLLLGLPAFAQSTAGTQGTSSTTPATASCPECPKCKDCSRGKTENYRDDSFGQVMVGYQFATTWVLGRKTLSYTQVLSRDWSIELEYGTAKRNVTLFGHDLGELSEQRYSLMGKYYVGNSFYTGFGPYMYDLSMKTENTVSDAVGTPISDRWKLQGYGLSFAFGNRWISKSGITWGVDWIRMNVPFIDGLTQRRKDLDSQDQINSSRDFKILRRAPTFTFVGVSIGYTF